MVEELENKEDFLPMARCWRTCMTCSSRLLHQNLEVISNLDEKIEEG